MDAMVHSLKAMWLRSRSASILLAAILAGCTTTDMATEDTSAEGVVEDAAGQIERWGCGDYLDDCMFRCPFTLTLTANVLDGTGTVTLSGIVEHTNFQIQGIERRWDWCPNEDGRDACAFVISPDGTGKYYNFKPVIPDEDGASRAKPSDHFKCSRRRTGKARG